MLKSVLSIEWKTGVRGGQKRDYGDISTKNDKNFLNNYLILCPLDIIIFGSQANWVNHACICFCHQVYGSSCSSPC